MPIPSRTLAVLLVSAAAATAGCATAGGTSRDASAQGTRSASPVSAFFARFGVGTRARSDSTMYGGTYGTYGPYPELDPDRKISEQDCTRQIVRDGGNLRCK